MVRIAQTTATMALLGICSPFLSIRMHAVLHRSLSFPKTYLFRLFILRGREQDLKLISCFSGLFRVPDDSGGKPEKVARNTWPLQNYWGVLADQAASTSL